MSNTGHSWSSDVLLGHGGSVIKGVWYLAVEMQNKSVYAVAACAIGGEAAAERCGHYCFIPFVPGGRLSHQQARTMNPHHPKSSREQIPPASLGKAKFCACATKNLRFSCTEMIHRSPACILYSLEIPSSLHICCY